MRNKSDYYAKSGIDMLCRSNYVWALSTCETKDDKRTITEDENNGVFVRG